MFGERLVPWIDGQFRTLGAAAERLLVGADEAGFAAAEIALRYPAVFGNAVAQSLFPLSGGDVELLNLIDAATRRETRFHVDWGAYDPRRTKDKLDVPGFSRRVKDRLEARGFAVTGGATNDGSTVVFWAARAARAIGTLLPAR
jgi:enterochelin esterase family protein